MKNKKLKKLISFVLSALLLINNLAYFWLEQANASNIPTVSNVAMSWDLRTWTEMIWTYDFDDLDWWDTESWSLFAWYRSTTNGWYSLISWATGSKYTIIWADTNRYLKFEVTPVSDNIPNTWAVVSSTWFFVDYSAPTGWSFLINNWDLSTFVSWVELNITCPTDETLPVEFAYANTSSPSNWTTCIWAQNIAHDIDTIWWDWNKLVYVRFRDSYWNTTANISRTIKYDTLFPSGWSVSHTDWYQNNLQIQVDLFRWSDSLSWMSDEDSDYLLEYKSAVLTGWICQTYWIWNWAWAPQDSTSTWYVFNWTEWNCYKFQYWVEDEAWNRINITSLDETKISTQTPIATCLVEEWTNTWYQVAWSDTVYYNSNFNWSFDVVVEAEDEIAWIEKIIFPSIWTWFTSSWEDLSFPYLYEYLWDLSATTSPQTMTAIVISNSSLKTTCSFTVRNDILAPASWTTSYLPQFRTQLSAMTITVDDWIDSWIWINTWSRILEVSTGTLSAWSCLSYWGFVEKSFTWSYPNIAQESDYDQGTCVRHRWRVSDHVWNEVIYESINDLKVDISEPTINITNINDWEDNMYYNSWLIKLFYKTLDSINRVFTVLTTTNDLESWIEKVSFPELWAWFTWSWEVFISPFSSTYSVLASSQSTNTWVDVISYNNAGLTEYDSFDVISDNAAPIDVWVTCPIYDNDDWSFTLTWSSWSDDDSWVNTSASSFKTRTWEIALNECSFVRDYEITWWFNDTVLSETTVPDWCYEYIYHSQDNVWNVNTGASCLVKVDFSDPIINTYTVSEDSEFIFLTWSNLYYSNTNNTTQTFSLVWSASDPDTDIEFIFWENEFWDSPIENTWSFTLDYSIENWSTCWWNNIWVTAQNNAWGLSTDSSLSCLIDNSSPVNVWVTCPSDYDEDWTYTLTWSFWNDPSSWLKLWALSFKYRTWTLSLDGCSSQNSFVNAWSIWDTDLTETSMANWCHEYVYHSEDNVWNVNTGASCIVKIDYTDPIVDSYSVLENSEYIYWTWTSVYYSNTNPLTQVFSIVWNASDPDSDIQSISWENEFWDSPNINNSSFTLDYSIESWSTCLWNNIWITAQNNAGGSYSDPGVSCIIDNAPPINVWVTCPSDYDEDWTYTLTWSFWNDLISWIKSSALYFKYRAWTLNLNECSIQDSFVYTWWIWNTDLNENANVSWCFEYIYHSEDNVWNVSTGASCIVKVDHTSPVLISNQVIEDSDYIFLTWSDLYFKNNPPSTQTFSIVWNAWDPETDVEVASWSLAFDDELSVNSWAYILTYSIEDWTLCEWDEISVSAKNFAWMQAEIVNITCINDIDAPIWWSVSNTDWYETDWTINVDVDMGSDAISWMSNDPNDYLLEMQTWSMSEWICSLSWDWTDTNVTENPVETWYIVTSNEATCYSFRYIVKDKVWNVAIYTWSSITKVTSQIPEVVSCDFEEVLGMAYQIAYSGPQLYYNSIHTWSFNLNITASASIAWIKSISFPEIWLWFNWSGVCLSWDCSQNYSWDLSAWTPWTSTAIIVANNDLSTKCNFYITDDTDLPWSWSISYQTQYRNLISMFPSVTVDDGQDEWSWIDESSRLIRRKVWTLSWDSCITYWDFTDSTYSSSYPNIEDNAWVVQWYCYKYQWQIKDNVWNEYIYSDDEDDEYKIDISIPLVYVNNMTLGTDNLYYKSWDKELYYKTNASEKETTLNAFALDPSSEINRVLFPYLWSWFSSSWEVAWVNGQYLYDYDYRIFAWTNISTWTKEIVGINNAGLSEYWAFNIFVDNEMPTGVSISCPSAYDIDWNYLISWSYWIDIWAWINSDLTFMRLRTWTIDYDNCSWYSSYADVWNNKGINLSQNSLWIWCYEYQYYSEDLVWNINSWSTCVMRVDLTDPIEPTVWVTETSSYIYYNSTWEILYYANQFQTWQFFYVSAISSDSDTDIQLMIWSEDFDDSPIDNTWVAILEYSIENSGTCWGSLNITARNNAWREKSHSIDCIEDNVWPFWWSVSNTNWYETDTWILVTVDKWSDSLSDMSFYDEDYRLEYQETTLSWDTCYPFTWLWLDANVDETVDGTWYTVISSGWHCYQFRYFVKDRVLNESVYLWSDITKVDTTAPILSEIETSEDSIYVYYWSSSWTLYYNNQYNSAFDILLWYSDVESAISYSSWSLEFWDSPIWVDSTNPPYNLTYTIWVGETCKDWYWPIDITLTNRAMLTTTWELVCQVDVVSPYSWSVLNSTWYETWVRMPIIVDRWEDDLSRLSVVESDYTFDYRYKTLTWNVCRWDFSSWVSGIISPSTTWTWDFILATWTGVQTSTWYSFASSWWFCYQFRYSVTDNVANPSTWTWESVTKVDKTPPDVLIDDIREYSDYLHHIWTDIYYNSKKPDNLMFNFNVTTSDVESAIYKVSWTPAFNDSPIDYTWSYQSWSISWTYSINYWVWVWDDCTSFTINTENHAGLVTGIDYVCYDDTTLPNASIRFVSNWAYATNWNLIMSFSDPWENPSWIRDCRVWNTSPNAWISWWPWQVCTTNMSWNLPAVYWIRKINLDVRDNVWNITRVSYDTLLKYIDGNKYSWWGWGWGWWWWGWWGDSSVSYWSTSIGNYAQGQLETKDEIVFENFHWAATVPIIIKNVSSDHKVEIPQWTQIYYLDWKEYNWTIKPPVIIPRRTIPLALWDIPPLRVVEVWDKEGESIYFSKPIRLTISTKWITSVVDRKNIRVYSFKDKTWIYSLEDANRKIDTKKETITVEVNHMTTFALLDEREVQNTRNSKVVYTPFEDINNHWAKLHIEKLYKLWILARKSNFLPSNELTRAELVKIAIEAFWSEVWEDLSSWNNFSNIKFDDVDNGQWYAPYLSKAVELWIVDKPTFYKVDVARVRSRFDIINVQKILKFLKYDIEITWKSDDQTVRALIKYQKTKWLSNPLWWVFDWTVQKLNNEPSVIHAISNKWLIYSKFRPQDPVNRAEAVKIMIKASWIKLITLNKQIFKDVKKASWYAQYVNTASMHNIISWYWNWIFGPINNVTRGQMAKVTSNLIEEVKK